MEISIIDGPGLEDTQMKDNLRLACHRKFLDTHPQLKNVKPNIVMVVHKITDDRIGSENDQESSFIRVLRKLKSILSTKLLNEGGSNVIFVLTSVESIPFDIQETIEEQFSLVRQLSMKYLGIENPPIVAVENYPDKCSRVVRDKKTGWYTLSNGVKHPLQLFNTLVDMCERNEDFLGMCQ